MGVPLVRVLDLGREYRAGETVVRALQGVSLQIAEGEFVSIMGPSGSGKSTLMNLLGLLDRPSYGHHSFNGKPVSTLGSDAAAYLRNREIGFVFQTFNLLARSTALENVELPLIYAGKRKKVRKEQATEALRRVGLAHRLGHWPRQLSGGEQQRVAIARALVVDPRLILADEPTGALDSQTGLEILGLLQRLNRAGRTIVMVTHDLTVARHAGRVVSMADGRIIADEQVRVPLEAGVGEPADGVRPEPVPALIA